MLELNDGLNELDELFSGMTYHNIDLPDPAVISPARGNQVVFEKSGREAYVYHESKGETPSLSILYKCHFE